MTLLERIQNQISQLPPEKQSEVLDFVTFLGQRSAPPTATTSPRTLRQHRAFGLWRERAIDALHYEQTLRAEWEGSA